MSSSEDENLARAVALSLETANTKRPVEVVDLISDDDDDDRPDQRFERDMKRPDATAESTHKSDNPVVASFLSERAQLEKERRERQKRLRGIQDSQDEPFAKRQHPSSLRPNDSRSSTLSSLASSSSSTSTPYTPSPAHTNINNGEQLFFFNGELRQTATEFAEPRKDRQPTFQLTGILGNTSELAFAILSSYSLDLPWIYQFFDPKVPVIVVAQPDETGEATLKYFCHNWIKATAALSAGRGCMHMKFMLLFYKNGRLRVVVSTANLIGYDWRSMENDLQMRSSPIPHDPRAPEDFPTVLQRVLHAVNVRPALATMLTDSNLVLPIKSIEDLRMRWDWSKVKVHLVPSIAGKHEGWPNVIKTGHTRLMIAVRNMGLRSGKDRTVTLECQGSSLGYYTTQWMNEFHWSARGESAEDWLDHPKRQREKLPYPPIKVIFPTKKIVQESALGEPGGGTIFCRRRQWAAKNFPRGNFYESKSKAGSVLMHSKMIIALFKNDPSPFINASADSDTEDDDDEIQILETAVGWAYVGSHNFTNSAWGTLSGYAFNPILNVSNYELGVVFPIKDAQHADKLACWLRPPNKYGSRDEPWIQEESVHHQVGE